MTTAAYYSRAAMAASQILENFDQSEFLSRVTGSTIAVSIGSEAASSQEGSALVDLLIRVLARLYPRLVLESNAEADVAGGLALVARAINPDIEIGETGEADISIVVGVDAPSRSGAVIYAGCEGWNAKISTEKRQSLGQSANPLGAGAAACLAAANVFRFVFAGGATSLDQSLEFSSWMGASAPPELPTALGETLTLVGVGAIGNAAAWALARLPTALDVNLVDHQTVELSNLQRYVLAQFSDVGMPKVDVVGRYFGGSTVAASIAQTWAGHVESVGGPPRRVLVAVDSAIDRRAVQASLPEFIVNAWTQPGDLGVSRHTFLGEGACLRCLYLPDGQIASQDIVVADALRVPDELMRIRELLFRGGGAPKELLDIVAARFGVGPEVLAPYEGQPVQKLLAEGICGGAVLPLGVVSAPRDLHVPLAHQSALAGVLLAAAGITQILDGQAETSHVTRINVMAPLHPSHLTQPALKDPRGICICQDPDYREAYRLRYEGRSSLGPPRDPGLRARSPRRATVNKRGAIRD